jgi:hypothetical protein
MLKLSTCCIFQVNFFFLWKVLTRNLASENKLKGQSLIWWISNSKTVIHICIIRKITDFINMLTRVKVQFLTRGNNPIALLQS